MTDPTCPGPLPPVPSTADIVLGAEDFPSWIDRRYPLLFIALGAVAAVAVAREPAEHSWVFAVALVALAVSPWALSLVGLRFPDSVFSAVVLVPVAVLIVGGEGLGIVDLDGGGPQLVLMVLVGIVGQMATIATRPVFLGTTAAAFVIVAAGAVVRGDPLDFAPWIVGILLAVGGGLAFRANAIYVAELRVAQEALAKEAFAAERRRIAREVHDIVAHTMSVTMLHLTAARLAVRSDPEAAEQALAEAERQGRASMDDIRGVVRLLRSDEGSLDAALPVADDLHDLVQRFIGAGSDVRMWADDLGVLTPAVRLTVYRVIQESLTNAARHGCDPVDVHVTVSADDGSVEVTVVNDLQVPPAEPSPLGTGIAGMRERVEATGGTFEAGRTDRRWQVRARIGP